MEVRMLAFSWLAVTASLIKFVMLAFVLLSPQ